MRIIILLALVCIFYDLKNHYKWNNYFIFDLIYDEKLSIKKIVKNIRITIAETRSYSNILNDDCNSYPIPPAPTIPNIVAILTFLSRIYKLFATKAGSI